MLNNVIISGEPLLRYSNGHQGHNIRLESALGLKLVSTTMITVRTKVVAMTCRELIRIQRPGIVLVMTYKE